MTQYVQILTTAGSEQEARAISRALVEKRLAACVHIVGPITSFYWWQGKMEEGREWQCLIKTRRDCFAQVQSTIRQTHSYQVPAILAFPVLEGSRSYLEWMEQELQGKGEE